MHPSPPRISSRRARGLPRPGGRRSVSHSAQRVRTNVSNKPAGDALDRTLQEPKKINRIYRDEGRGIVRNVDQLAPAHLLLGTCLQPFPCASCVPFCISPVVQDQMEAGRGGGPGALLEANTLRCGANVSPAAHLQGLGFFGVDPTGVV